MKSSNAKIMVQFCMRTPSGCIMAVGAMIQPRLKVTIFVTFHMWTSVYVVLRTKFERYNDTAKQTHISYILGMHQMILVATLFDLPMEITLFIPK